MIKFILAVIAMIFVGLAAYVYMNPKETDAHVVKVAQKTEKSIVKKETPSVQKESIIISSHTIERRKNFVAIPIVAKSVNQSEMKNSHSSSVVSSEEEIQNFEEKIAQEFIAQSQYTGPIYGRDDFEGNEVSVDESHEEENMYTEEWQQKEVSSPLEE